jgi:hypothetical protein
VPPEQFKASDDNRGTSDHRVERSNSLLPAEPLDPFDQKFQVGLQGTEIDAFEITSWLNSVEVRLA